LCHVPYGALPVPGTGKPLFLKGFWVKVQGLFNQSDFDDDFFFQTI
jgi:hypothetical protein